ncbi:unnamed protein product [Paramecium sonneborni]|uniref:Tetratricopeptide repeat protein n=1 Tax=Paramecium sonneborni TaxID=65129 RepID=A0A8S1REI1_9CILI|nr:unnamed protein product [Paramecium sonneborni]
MQRFEEALEQSNFSTQINPEFNLGYKIKADALIMMNRYIEALEVLKISIQLNREDVVSYNNIAMVLSRLNRCEEALIYIDTSIHINPTLSILYLNKGLILLNLNRLEEALDCINQSLIMDPQQNTLSTTKALILTIMGHYEQALQELNKIPASDENNKVSGKIYKMNQFSAYFNKKNIKKPQFLWIQLLTKIQVILIIIIPKDKYYHVYTNGKKHCFILIQQYNLILKITSYFKIKPMLQKCQIVLKKHQIFQIFQLRIILKNMFYITKELLLYQN